MWPESALLASLVIVTFLLGALAGASPGITVLPNPGWQTLTAGVYLLASIHSLVLNLHSGQTSQSWDRLGELMPGGQLSTNALAGEHERWCYWKEDLRPQCLCERSWVRGEI